MKSRSTASAVPLRCLVLLAALASAMSHAATRPPALGIEWFLDCPQPELERLDPEVIERTQCGIVTAPLDHAAPERGRISFGITRVGARQPLSRQGALFANPGGPGLDTGGVFAVHLAAVWKHYARQPEWGGTYRTLADTFDVVEVTPRGLGNVPGSRLECRSNARIVPQEDAREDRSEANLIAIRNNARLIAQACAGHPLTPYITTEQTARDLEFVRKQLGELEFNYLGNAYGTWLGAWYAGLYPENVGRMVLDSNINWKPTFEHASLIVAGEKEKTFDRFVAHPAALDPGLYQLGDSPIAVRRVFMTLLPSVRTALRSNNRYYSDPAGLMGAQVLSRWLRETPDSDDLALEARARAHPFSPNPALEGRARLMFSLLLQRVRAPLQASVPKPGQLRMSAADSVRTAILCNDSVYSSEASGQRKDAQAPRLPVAGSALEARQCTTWPRKNARPLPYKKLAQLDSLLMVQTELDEQTPASGAAWAFERTLPASLVQLKGASGVSFSAMSACVNRWVGDYLAHGTKPPRSTVCKDARAMR